MANKKMRLTGGKKHKSRSAYSVTYPRPESREVYHVGTEREVPPVRETAPKPEYRSVPEQRAAQHTKAHKKASSVRVPANAKKKKAASTGLKRSEKKKQKKNVSGMIARSFIAACVLVAGIVISIFILFKIGSVKVVGNEKYSAAQIIEASEVELGDNLFAPTTPMIEKRVGTKLPYVKKITLKHELPDKLVICVQEAQADYAFKVGSKFLLTDEELKLLDITDKLPHGTAVIEGVGLKGAEIGETAAYKDSQKGECVDLIRMELAKNKLDRITLIDVRSSVDLKAIYNDQITILFGQADQMDYKCALAAKSIESVLSQNKNSEGTINVKQAAQTKQAYFDPD